MRTKNCLIVIAASAFLLCAQQSSCADSEAPSKIPAAIILRVDPVYPKALKDRGITGSVRVGFDVDKDGKVRRPYIIEPSSDVRFDDAALAAVRKWKFSPCVIDGKPKLVHLSQWIYFGFEQPESNEPNNKAVDPTPGNAPRNSGGSSEG